MRNKLLTSAALTLILAAASTVFFAAHGVASGADAFDNAINPPDDLSPATQPALTGPAYQIKILRPQAVGSTYWVSGLAHSYQMNKRLSEDNNTDIKESEIRISGHMNVTAVNNLGQPIGYDFTVTKCTKDNKPVVDSGAVVAVSNVKGAPVYKVNGATLDQETTMALSSVLFSIDPEHTFNGDTAFGTSTPQQVNGTWPVDKDVAAMILSRIGIAIPKDKIDAQGKLLSVEMIDGKQTEIVEISMSAGDVRYNKENPGQRISISSQMLLALPTDSTAHAVGEKSSFYISQDDDSLIAIPEYHGGPMMEMANKCAEHFTDTPPTTEPSLTPAAKPYAPFF